MDASQQFAIVREGGCDIHTAKVKIKQHTEHIRNYSRQQKQNLVTTCQDGCISWFT